MIFELIFKYIGYLNKAIKESQDLFDVIVEVVKQAKEDYQKVTDEQHKG